MEPDSWASPERIIVADTDKKPPGWGKFIALAKRVLAVAKEDVDARIAAKKAKSTHRR